MTDKKRNQILLVLFLGVLMGALDIAIVSVARYAAPHAKLLLDVNGGWDMAEAPLMIEKLAEYSPTLIEQPIHHRLGVDGWEELRALLPGNPPPHGPPTMTFTSLAQRAANH